MIGPSRLRAFLLHFLLSLTGAACAKSAPPVAPKPPLPPLHLAPIADLAPAAGLHWIAIAKPRALAARADLIPALYTLMPEDKLAEFGARNGGVNLLALDEIAVAGYAKTTLCLARGLVDPGRVEASFRARFDASEDRGRAVDREGNGQAIVRLWGNVHGDREQLAIFGRDAIALEIGRFAPLRASEMFAEERLKKASPALHVEPLAHAADLVGDAPVRAFALGPFEGDDAHLFAGLLGASTAAALAVQVRTAAEANIPAGAAHTQDLAVLEVTLVLTGGWNESAPLAAERLRAALHTLAESPIGRLTGLDRPLTGPVVTPSPDALRITATFDALTLARGLRALTGAEVSEIFAY